MKSIHKNIPGNIGIIMFIFLTMSSTLLSALDNGLPFTKEKARVWLPSFSNVLTNNHFSDTITQISMQHYIALNEAYTVTSTENNLGIQSQNSQMSQYNLNIVISLPSDLNNPISEICDATSVHFNVTDMMGQTFQIPSGYTLEWQYSDDGGTNYTVITPVGTEFSGTSFPVGPSNTAIRADCPNSPFGFTNRIYRFRLIDDINTSYYTVSAPLKICCRVPSFSINFNNTGLTNNLCEGDEIQFDISLNLNFPTPDPPNNEVTINWWININGISTPLSGPEFENQTNILYPSSNNTIIVGTGFIQFIAEIKNCACPPRTINRTVNIEAMPLCGTIKPAVQNPLIPASAPDHYYICPGLSTTLEVDQPFANCNMIWEYMFPSEGTWHPTNGTGNHAHNTNILPQVSPPISPYLWPAGETCIKYRIKCLPLNYPNSACDPCHSNEITICLIDTPQKPVVNAVPNPFCFGGYSDLSVINPEPGITYTWNHNGFFFGPGNAIQTISPGNYWVFASDTYGCHSVMSDKILVNTCIISPVIICPEPSCPCTGDEILLSASLSQSTCGQNLSFQWTWDGGQPVSVNGSELMHIPAPAGTTYTVIVTDAYGCSASKTILLIPCDCSTSFTCGTSTVTFDYNGNQVTYGTVVGANNRCWLDRNLGASQVATSSTDANAYGDLFQWGRLADGHQIRTSPTTSTLSNSDVPGHGDFILVSNSPHDWRSPQNSNLWQGVIGTNNPCPAGFRLPTKSEWETELQSWSSDNAIGAFNSTLRLPLAGARERINGMLFSVGTGGLYWSGTVSGDGAFRFGFINHGASITTFNRAEARSVRCIKD